MMPWWSWLVIWGGLVLLLLAVLVWLTYRIVIKLFSALLAFGDLAEKAELLDVRAEQLAEEHAQSAIFANAAELAARRRARMEEKQHRHQTRREVRVLRGKLLVKADPHQFSPLGKRT